MKKILLIDAHSLIHRSFHALPPLTAPDGKPTGALYGVSSTLLRVLKEKSPDYVVAAFDRPEPTFRKEQYAEYKAHRPKAPDELISQLKESRELFKKFGIYISEIPGYEGDDIIGTLSEKFSKEEGVFITILTGDLDTLQLVKNGKVEVETFKKGINDAMIYDENAVRERLGVTVEHVPDYKGLVGDQSDNIPGIPGVGPKTAAQLISKYGTIEHIYASINTQDPLFKKIGEHKKIALLSKNLATIKRDVPIDVSLEEAKYEKLDLKKLEEYFDYLGFESLIKRLGLSRGGGEKKDENTQYTTHNNVFVVYDWKEKIKLKESNLISPDSVFDIKIAAWLLDPDKNKLSVDDISKRFLKTISSNDDLGVLYKTLEESIKNNKLEKVFYGIEMPLIPILARMESTGILCDDNLLVRLEKKIKEETKKTEEKIIELAGEKFNISSPRQVGDILFTKLHIKENKKHKTKTGMNSTAESVLVELKDQHPIIEHILVYRENMKILSTYVSPLLEYARADADHRIHTTYIQTGTATGRLSSEKPNLQNIPQESKWSKELREAFIPKNGFSFLSFDYSQLELRLLAHISGDEKLLSAFLHGKDIHNITAAQIFNVDESAVTPELRRIAKTLNFGVAYGMGPRAFSATSGISIDDAKRFINEYFSDFPKVKEWQEKMRVEAQTGGTIRNETGRIRVFPSGIKNKKIISEMERAAINMPVQSLGADIIKLSMVAAQKFIDIQKYADSMRLILTIHDELIFEVRDDILKSIIAPVKYLMEHPLSLLVPLTVEVKIGKDWGNMKKYE